jgi:hypothetical protein
MLDDFQTYRQILFDLTANYLEPLDGSFARLAYLSGLWGSSGKYVQADVQDEVRTASLRGNLITGLLDIAIG